MSRFRGHLLVALLLAGGFALAVAEEKEAKPKAMHPGLERIKQLAGEWMVKSFGEESVDAAGSPGDKTEKKDAAPEKSADKADKKGASADKADKKDADGHKEAVDKAGKADAKDAKGEADGEHTERIIYKVIAAGSAVEESMFPGTPHEMVTMYHTDGPDLLLTHYCAAGNQPRMKVEKGGEENQLVFKFAGGTNLDAAQDAHMHDLTITFIDADHIREVWTYYKDGKAVAKTKIELERKKG